MSNYSDRARLQSQAPAPLQISPATSLHWRNVSDYNTKLRSMVAAGVMQPESAPYASTTTSAADLTNLIRSNGVPWSGPLPSEQGLHSGTSGVQMSAHMSGVAAVPSGAAPIAGTLNDRAVAMQDFPQIERSAAASAVAPAPVVPTPSAQLTPDQRMTAAMTPSPLFDANATANRGIAAANATNPIPVPPDAQHGGYGKIGQTPAQPDLSDVQAGVRTPTGGFVQSNTPVASGGASSGIFVNGVPQIRGQDGKTFVASGAPMAPAVAASVKPPVASTLDAASQKAIVAQYPEIGIAGTWANNAFKNNLNPGQNSLADAQGALQRIIAPPTPATPPPLLERIANGGTPALGTPQTIPPIPQLIGQLPSADTNAGVPGFGTVSSVVNNRVPDAPPLALNTGAAPAPSTTGIPSLDRPVNQAIADINNSGSTITANDINKPPAPTTPQQIAANDRIAGMAAAYGTPAAPAPSSRMAGGYNLSAYPPAQPTSDPASGVKLTGALAASAQVPSSPAPSGPLPLPGAGQSNQVNSAANAAQSLAASPVSPAAPAGPGPSPGPDYVLVNGQWVKRPNAGA